MSNLRNLLDEIEKQFAFSTSTIQAIAASFQESMVDGLVGRPSSLKMLPSYIGTPTGQEQGKVVAVDFGGTNIRVLLIGLIGHGQFKIINKSSFPLKEKEKYDYTAVSASGQQLFTFIAEKVAEIVPNSNTIYPLGLTFSFPCCQYSVNEAKLISWTKEFKTKGVEGKDVGQLLQQALVRKGLEHVVPQAVINDTTGTLLTAAYIDHSTDIGTICGTGHNSCYLEPCHPLTGQPMIVNMESGNFDRVVQTKYDVLLDEASEKPGAQRLEKMSSGHYLGEILRLMVSSLVAHGCMEPGDSRLNMAYSFPTEDISTILADKKPGLPAVANVAANRWGMFSLRECELTAMQRMAQLVTTRAARLVAATWAGVLFKIDPGLKRRHSIAVDGSLYEKMPGYAGYVLQAMQDIFRTKADQVSIKLSKDGSGVGAAIAAATVFCAK